MKCLGVGVPWWVTEGGARQVGGRTSSSRGSLLLRPSTPSQLSGPWNFGEPLSELDLRRPESSIHLPRHRPFLSDLPGPTLPWEAQWPVADDSGPSSLGRTYPGEAVPPTGTSHLPCGHYPPPYVLRTPVVPLLPTRVLPPPLQIPSSRPSAATSTPPCHPRARPPPFSLVCRTLLGYSWE